MSFSQSAARSPSLKLRQTFVVGGHKDLPMSIPQTIAQDTRNAAIIHSAIIPSLLRLLNRGGEEGENTVFAFLY